MEVCGIFVAIYVQKGSAMMVFTKTQIVVNYP